MKRIFNKVHHFSRRELITEEVIIVILGCFIINMAYAASAVMPIRVKIVQCGSRAELVQSCREDARCCALLDKARDEIRGEEKAFPPADKSADEKDQISIKPGDNKQKVLE